MKKLLLPIDFSDSSINTLHFAYEISTLLKFEITLLYVYPKKSFQRLYDFGKTPYHLGILKMLKEFCTQHISDEHIPIQFLALEGSIVENIVRISPNYSMIVLRTSSFQSKMVRWLGSRSSAIAAKSSCPVLIASTDTISSNWRNVWHICRNINEKDIVKKGFQKLEMDPAIIQEKSFKQKTFTSVFWKSIVKAINNPNDQLMQDLLQIKNDAAIDLMILVSQSPDTFEEFVTDDTLQFLFQFEIPIMIFQYKELQS